MCRCTAAHATARSCRAPGLMRTFDSLFALAFISLQPAEHPPDRFVTSVAMLGSFIDNESLRPVWDCAFPWFVCFYILDRRGSRDARFKPHLMRVHDPGAIPPAQPSKSTLPPSGQTLFMWIFALAARVCALRRLCTVRGLCFHVGNALFAGAGARSW